MTTAEAAKLKGVAINSVIVAIKRGDLNAVRFGRAWNVLDDEKFRAYIPTKDQRERSIRRWAKDRAAQPVFAVRESKRRYGMVKGAKAKKQKGGK